MKKTIPIILSSILAITVTTSVVHAASTAQEQSSFLSRMFGKNFAETMQNQRKLKVKAIQETLKQYKQLPSKRPYKFFGNKVYDAKPIMLKCVEQQGKEITVSEFAYCCGVADLDNKVDTCMDMIKKAIEKHNNRVEILEKCMPENDKLATAGHYVWVNGVKKCASTQCKAGYNTAKDEKGNSKGFCIKIGSSCQLTNAVMATIDNNGKCVATECKDGFGVTPTGSCDMQAETLETPQAQLAVAEIDPKLPSIGTPVETPDVTPDATSLVMTEQEAQQQVAQITLSDKTQQKIQENKNENECLAMGVTNLVERNKCKKDPAAYKACSSIPGLNGVEFNNCMKDPRDFAQQRINKANEESKKKELEAKCDALGATSGKKQRLCMQDPEAYASNKSECDSMNVTGNDFTSCVENPVDYKKKHETQIEAKEKGMNVKQYKKDLEEQQQLEAMQKLLG